MIIFIIIIVITINSTPQRGIPSRRSPLCLLSHSSLVVSRALSSEQPPVLMDSRVDCCTSGRNKQ